MRAPRAINARLAVLLVPMLVSLLPSIVHAATPGRMSVTERVSVDGAGNQGNGRSTMPAISANGRFVVFESAASNLVPGDTNGAVDILVRDRLKGTTERVSVDGAGNQGNDQSFRARHQRRRPRRRFRPFASNLVPGTPTAPSTSSRATAGARRRSG